MKKLEAGKVKAYGSFMAVTLAKKSKPGDGTRAKGIRKGL
ncbi:lariocidin family lasso peptide [Bacillus sp. NPDC094077]